jgi:hypothetical protein
VKFRFMKFRFVLAGPSKAAIGLAKFAFRIEQVGTPNPGGMLMGQIGQPVRRYTVVPLEEPVSPTSEPLVPPPPGKAPNSPAPVTKPEPEPAK